MSEFGENWMVWIASREALGAGVIALLCMNVLFTCWVLTQSSIAKPQKFMFRMWLWIVPVIGGMLALLRLAKERSISIGKSGEASTLNG